MSEELKIWIVVRQDITIPVGKLVVQGGHAVDWTLAAAPDDVVSAYRAQNTPKITVKAKNLAALDRAFKETQEACIPCAYIIDEGRTVFSEPTPTCIGIGPCYRTELPKFVQRFQMMD